jgi:hypothetical protein
MFFLKLNGIGLKPYNDNAWVGDYTYLGFYKPIQVWEGQVLSLYGT